MHWRDIDEIAEKLEENYFDEEIPEHRLLYLKEMVLSLNEFEDHEIEVSNDNLNQIIECWLEIRQNQ